MRIVLDTDLDPNLIRITVYSHSEFDVVAVSLELQRILMNLGAHQHYKRRDFQLVGYDNQEYPIARWEEVSSANSPSRVVPRRDELAEIELRTSIPPEDIPLPRKCLECLEECDAEAESPFPVVRVGDRRFKLPD